MHATKQASIDEACEELLKESQVGAAGGLPVCHASSSAAQLPVPLAAPAACYSVEPRAPACCGLQPFWCPQLWLCPPPPPPPPPLEPQCQYFKNVHSFSGSGYQYRLHDIEDLKGFGRSHKACPYFTARKWAEVRWRRVCVLDGGGQLSCEPCVAFAAEEGRYSKAER
jgi:hypothetical protein